MKRDPLGTEFGIVSDEIAYGRDMGEALNEMAARLDMPDLRFLAVAVAIQQQSGGNLAEVLAGLAKVIRERFKLFRKMLSPSPPRRNGRVNSYQASQSRPC